MIEEINVIQHNKEKIHPLYETIRGILWLVFAMLFAVAMIVGVNEASNAIAANASPQDTTVYMICDVYDIVTNGQVVEIDIILPNAELLTRQMSVDDDLPEEFSEVIVKTDNIDDYSTYEIVGMR